MSHDHAFQTLSYINYGRTGDFKCKHNQLCIRNETDLHYVVVKELRKRFPQLILIVCGGELQDTSEKCIDMWKKGFKGGQPDIMITNPHKDYNGFCIELKNPGGTGVLSDKQKEILERYDEMGWKTAVYDLVTVVLELSEYVKGVREICRICKRSRRFFKTRETLCKHLKNFHKKDPK